MKSYLDPDRLGRQLTESEHEVIAVATECAEVAGAPKKAFGDSQLLEASASARKKIGASVRAVYNSEKLETLQEKLEGLRDQLVFVIFLNLS